MPVTEAEWLACDDLLEMLYFLQYVYRKPCDRKLRLFACACCPEFSDENARKALEVAERLADGLADGYDCSAAIRALPIPEDFNTSIPHEASLVMSCLDEAIGRGCAQLRDIADLRLLRDVFGPLPFRSVVLDATRLTWKRGTVPRIADGIYDRKAFDELPLLADALEDAGCTDAELLGHLRGPGPHVSGCWALDLILGKE
jgi:hypothetical protein